jgi:hypothetical protein
MDQITAWGVVTVVGSFVGSFIGAYLKKKGENLATHEDLDKLVEQVRAVTTTTKEIEAKISTSVWDRQKRWEMKREVLFDATKRLGAVQLALRNYQVAFDVKEKRRQNGQAEMPQMIIDAGNKWFDAIAKFEETGLLVETVCGAEIKNACSNFQRLTTTTAAAINKGDLQIYSNSSAELREKAQAVTNAIRKELEADKTA